jgi:hypothetical protein
MTDFVRMTDGIPIQSATAAASMSLADATLRLRHARRRQDSVGVSLGDGFVTILISAVAILGILSSLFAMWTQQTILSYVAFGIVPSIIGPAVLIQRWKLQWMATFRTELQRVRNLAIDLAGHRLRLKSETDRLEREYYRIVDVEDRFREVVLKEGKSIEEYRALIQENARIQREIQNEQALREIHDLFAIVMTSDKNANGRVGRDEIERLIQRIRGFAIANGKLIDEDMIRSAFQRSTLKNSGYSQCAFSMFNVVQGALSDDEGDDGIVDQSASRSVPAAGDVELGNVKKTTPRVTATGLVLAYSVEDGEGGLARPIRAEAIRDTWVDLAPVAPVLPNRTSESTRLAI